MPCILRIYIEQLSKIIGIKGDCLNVGFTVYYSCYTVIGYQLNAFVGINNAYGLSDNAAYGIAKGVIAFNAFEINNIDPLTLLFQTGYITIKETEERFDQTWYYLDFPNREVAGAFSAYVLNSYAGKTQTVSVQFAAEIATALLNRDLKKLRKVMEVFFAGIPYTAHKKQESTFQTIFFSIFRLLGLYVEAESVTNDGRIDAVVQTVDAVFIFEFKLDNDPTALEQIRQKEYFKKYLLDLREIYIIGVNFDSIKGNLTGWNDAVIQGGIRQ